MAQLPPEIPRLERDPLLQEREKSHGDFKVTATAAQALKNAARDWNTKGIGPIYMESIEMICLKIARALQHPEVRDHWDDIIGYAKLAAEACPPVIPSHRPGGLTYVDR